MQYLVNSLVSYVFQELSLPLAGVGIVAFLLMCSCLSLLVTVRFPDTPVNHSHTDCISILNSIFEHISKQEATMNSEERVYIGVYKCINAILAFKYWSWSLLKVRRHTLNKSNYRNKISANILLRCVN